MIVNNATNKVVRADNMSLESSIAQKSDHLFKVIVIGQSGSGSSNSMRIFA